MNFISNDTTLVSNIFKKNTDDFFYILYSSIFGSILLAISSKIQIPLAPVPVTLQTMVLLVMSMFLGWKSALGATLMYLAEGLVGLPVFAKMNGFIFGGGINYLSGVTGGYLIGFVFAAPIVGFLSERKWDKSITLTFLAMLIGTAIIFTFGIGWLTFLLAQSSSSILDGFNKALIGGLIPFIHTEILKISLGTCIVAAGWEIKRKYFKS